MKIYLDMVGCRLNQAEIESYARQFRASGYTLADSPDGADLAVINTCAVTAAASSDSRQKIRQVYRAGTSKIVVTGCWATLHPDLAINLPGVARLVPNQHKDHLVADLVDVPFEFFDLEPLKRAPVPGSRGRTRAFIKVQDGCENRCTFCVTTLARGASRSRNIKEVLNDIHSACSPVDSDKRALEIVLTGVHLASWGKDLSPPQDLSNLITSIIQEIDTPRLRLSSLEPWDLEERFFELWQDKRLCRHLHLPLQSGSGFVLRRMARRTTPEEFADLVACARKTIHGLAVTTDLIAGFPGEDDARFAESLDFVRQMEFSGGHVFTYSARPGTAAANFPDQVPHPIRKERSAAYRAVLEESRRRYGRQFIGQVSFVLWESAVFNENGCWELGGLTDNNLRVNTTAASNLWNTISPVRLIAFDGNRFRGQILNG